jgi:hypothetical protein
MGNLLLPLPFAFAVAFFVVIPEEPALSEAEWGICFCFCPSPLPLPFLLSFPKGICFCFCPSPLPLPFCCHSRRESASAFALRLCRCLFVVIPEGNLLLLLPCAFAVAFLVVIPEGNLLLLLPFAFAVAFCCHS